MTDVTTLREKVAKGLYESRWNYPRDSESNIRIPPFSKASPDTQDLFRRMANTVIAIITEECANAIWPIYPPGFDHDNESIEVAAAKDVLALKIEERIRNLAKENTNV